MPSSILIAAAVVCALCTAVSSMKVGPGCPGGRCAPYAIGLWGDLPYDYLQLTTGLPNLIADINSQSLAFVAHVGDLKAGSTSCNDTIYTNAVRFFNSLKAPAVFTPGDNDWTDCDRATAGAYNSLERLDLERSLFFSSPFTMGMTRFRQEVQATPLCKGYGVTEKTDVPCVENRRWTMRKVVYMTANVQGSCNNLCDINPDTDEFTARNAANIAWLEATFAQAKETGARAVVVMSQADPGWDGSDVTRSQARDPKTLMATDGQPDGFALWLQAVRDQTIAFGLPVLYVAGDSHYFRIDKPLLNTVGQRLETFTRLGTFGDNAGNGNNDVMWVKVKVDPDSREVFSYQPQIVPRNRVAVPLPMVQA